MLARIERPVVIASPEPPMMGHDEQLHGEVAALEALHRRLARLEEREVQEAAEAGVRRAIARGEGARGGVNAR